MRHRYGDFWSSLSLAAHNLSVPLSLCPDIFTNITATLARIKPKLEYGSVETCSARGECCDHIVYSLFLFVSGFRCDYFCEFVQKLAHIDEERGRWQQYTNDYTQAEQNLIGFRESLQKDILVPIGSKALMPGTLYHTNEIFVGMYSGLFVKCTSHKAIELCQHRLKKSKERLDALDAEYKMYK